MRRRERRGSDVTERPRKTFGKSDAPESSGAKQRCHLVSRWYGDDVCAGNKAPLGKPISSDSRLFVFFHFKAAVIGTKQGGGGGGGGGG